MLFVTVWFALFLVDAYCVRELELNTCASDRDYNFYSNCCFEWILKGNADISCEVNLDIYVCVFMRIFIIEKRDIRLLHSLMLVRLIKLL